jgi:hypothetical protein
MNTNRAKIVIYLIYINGYSYFSSRQIQRFDNIVQYFKEVILGHCGTKLCDKFGGKISIRIRKPFFFS